ncbi:MAG: GNAT family N-acetyltransferase, partial [Desulfatitalea sp.]|nr:GNAT family N-acetyltransferase [Desulfatitalea sp.]
DSFIWPYDIDPCTPCSASGKYGNALFYHGILMLPEIMAQGTGDRKRMPRLYIEEYTRALAGTTACIACREGILRDHFEAVLADVKLLDRHGVKTVLYHNIANRFANQKYFRLLAARLPATRIVRVAPEADFYAHVLDHEAHVEKLIFLERKALVDQQGHKINAITTEGVRRGINAWADLIANTNFKGVLDRICTKIDHGHYDRVHILPAGKHAIKYELFTIEGHGTLIANNFTERFQPVSSEEDVLLIDGILKLYKSEGYIKPRTKVYLMEHRGDFFVTFIDDIVVGCVERKHIDPRTAEIAALAISTKFRNQRVGVFTVEAFMATMRKQGYTRFISLTNNPALKRLYTNMGFKRCRSPEYSVRQAESPDVIMYCKLN